MTTGAVALSVKQPWAALLATGRKTVEVRTWPTARRGAVYLHAARGPDGRPHGWTFLDAPDLVALAELGGGVVAVAQLVDCVTYADPDAFASDCHRHRNLPSWFRPPRLYGFVFADARPVPFRPVAGKTFFFPVPLPAAGAAPPAVLAANAADGAAPPAPAAPPPQTPALPTDPPRVIIIDPPENGQGRPT
jgi:hypothetical protein